MSGDEKVIKYYKEDLNLLFYAKGSVDDLIESHKRQRQIILDFPRPFPPHSDDSFLTKLKWCLSYLRSQTYHDSSSKPFVKDQ